MKKEETRKQDIALLNSVIDPSDPDSILVWYELRRQVFHNPKSILSIKQTIDSLNFVALAVMASAGYIAFKLFIS